MPPRGQTTTVFVQADEEDPVALAAVEAHNAATTNVHGLADTGVLVTDSDLANYSTTSTVDSQVAAKVDKSTLTTKGDLYVASAAGVITRIAAGTNAQVLTADSSQTAGVKWADSAAGSAAPSGAAGGDLTGTYPDPTIGASKVTAAKASTGTGSGNLAIGNDSRFPTAGEKQALAGTSGTPGTGNEYVTKAVTDAMPVINTTGFLAGDPLEWDGTQIVRRSTVATILQKSINQAILTSTQSWLSWDTEIRDNGNWHSNSSNPTRITVGSDGWYRISLSLAWTGSTSSYREARLVKNGATFLSGSDMQAAFTSQQNIFWEGPLVNTDYVEIGVFQDSGVTREITGIATANAWGNTELRVVKASNS